MRLIPRAAANEIVGEREGALVVRVTAAPVDGRANTALCRLLAKRLGVGSQSVSLVRGASSRDKVVEVEGVSEEVLRSKLRSQGNDP